MAQDTLTPAQTRVLELLGAFDYLTTRQIHDYLGAATTKRATEQKLRRLKAQGFLVGQKLQPERGAASEQCWRLLRKGADSVEAPFDLSALRAQDTVTPGQAAVLHLLAEMKQLSTTQIWQQLHRGKSKRYTRLMLYRLRKAGSLRSRQLYPERGAASEHYWMLTAGGAAAIGAGYDARYRRRPVRESIEHRGLLLELGRQVQDAGWSLLHPHSRRLSRTPIEEMPQHRQLVEAVLRKEQLAIDALLSQGYPQHRLQERIDRYRTGHVGAIVPHIVNEHVAFIPGQPERTVLLIPHPPLAGRGFWTRSPGQRAGRPMRPTKASPRTSKYARLAQVVPVLAVFSDEERGLEYADILRAAGFNSVVAHEVRERLRRLAQPSTYG